MNTKNRAKQIKIIKCTIIIIFEIILVTSHYLGIEYVLNDYLIIYGNVAYIIFIVIASIILGIYIEVLKKINNFSSIINILIIFTGICLSIFLLNKILL